MRGKLFGLILIVLLVWVAIEVFDKGVDHAFGGLFTGFRAPSASEAAAPQQSGSMAQRIGAKVRADIERGAQRDGVEDSDDQDTD